MGSLARRGSASPQISVGGPERHASAKCRSRFRQRRSKKWIAIWACSILPEHIHLVIARHAYEIEQISNLLKGEATKEIKDKVIHPQVRFVDAKGKLPSMWAEQQWKVFRMTNGASPPPSSTSKSIQSKRESRSRNGRSSPPLPASRAVDG